MSPSLPLPALVIANFLMQSLGYFVLVGLLYLLVWYWGKERFHHRRIPAPQRVNKAQILRELGNTLIALLMGTVSASAILVMFSTGNSGLTFEERPFWEIGLWVVGGLVVNDLWFYGWHRLLHHPRLFRYVHRVHHQSIDVNPFTSYSFHGVEALILGLWVVPATIWLPVPVAALGVLQGVGLANNLMSHLGYEFLPTWILRVPILRWTNTATFHSLHHTRSRGNFGLHSRLWDRLFGTELPEYERVFWERGGPDPSKVEEG